MDYTDEELAEIAGVSIEPQQSSYDNISDEELASIAGVELTPNVPKNSDFQSFTMGAADAASIGLDDELRGFGRALGTKIRGDERPFTELWDLGKTELRQEHNEARTDNPYMYGGGQVTGAVAGSIAPAKGLASVAKLAKYARAKPITAAAGAGATSGGLYGFNSGEEGAGERFQEAGYNAGVGAAMGPVGAYIGQKALSPLVNKLTTRAPSVTAPEQLPSIANNKYGEALPLTQGQATGDLSRQSMEIAARKGAYGDKAYNAITQNDAIQQGAIRSNFDALGAGGENDLVNTGNAIRNAYKGQKAKVSRAYDNADIINDVYVNKQPIQDIFVPKFKETLGQFNLDERDLSEQGKRLFKDMQSLKGDNITAVNLARMEKWRGRASNVVANNNAIKGNATEGAAFKKVIDDYDRFMAKLPEDALKSGDEEALQAITAARGQRRKQGVLFERDKVVKKIVQSQDITDEELANMVLTGSGRSESVNSSSGRIIKNLKRAAGDNAPQVQEGIKRGVLGRVLSKGTSTVTEGDTAIRTLDPAKLRNELDKLLKNTSFMKEVFTSEEILQIGKVHRDLTRIASEKPGANNYSNTAYAFMRLVNFVPTGRALVGDAAKNLGDRMATKDIKRGLSPVLNTLIDETTATKRFFGATVAGQQSNKIVDDPDQ